MCSILVSVKKGGLWTQAEIKDPESLKIWMNRPPKKDSAIRVASIRGTNPGSCVLYWNDEENKRVEIKAEIV